MNYGVAEATWFNPRNGKWRVGYTEDDKGCLPFH